MTSLRGTYGGYGSYAFFSGTVSSSAVSLEDLGFSSDQIKAADVVYISVETDSIRWRMDGVDDPDSSTGHLVTDGSSFEIWGAGNIGRLRMIAVATDATVQVSMARSGVGIS